jgi:hypothetical protein
VRRFISAESNKPHLLTKRHLPVHHFNDEEDEFLIGATMPKTMPTLRYSALRLKEKSPEPS